MGVDQRSALSLLFVTGETELPIPSVSEILAQAVDHFLKSGKEKSALHWVRIDAFARETIWEGREGREAWERANPSSSRDA